MVHNIKLANYEKYIWSDGDLCEKVTFRLSNGSSDSSDGSEIFCDSSEIFCD